MRIGQMIREQKERFRYSRYMQREAKLNKEKEDISRLKQERDMVKRIHDVRVEKENLQKEMDSMKGTSKIKRFGKGLAKVMNQGRANIAEAKKKGHLKGPQFGSGGKNPFQ